MPHYAGLVADLRSGRGRADFISHPDGIRFLSGKTEKLSEESVIRIARVFNVSTDFILGTTVIDVYKRQPEHLISNCATGYCAFILCSSMR